MYIFQNKARSEYSRLMALWLFVKIGWPSAVKSIFRQVWELVGSTEALCRGPCLMDGIGQHIMTMISFVWCYEILDMVPVEKNKYICAVLCKYTKRRSDFLFCKDTPPMVCATLHPRCLPNENAILLDVGIGSRLVFESKVFGCRFYPSLCVSQSLMSFLQTSLASEVGLFYWNMNFLIGTDPLGAQQWEKLGGWGMLHEERTIFFSTYHPTPLPNINAMQLRARTSKGDGCGMRWGTELLLSFVGGFAGFCGISIQKCYKFWLHESYVLGVVMACGCRPARDRDKL